MVTAVKVTLWKGDNDRDLIRLDGDKAYIIPATVDADTLRDLAEACCMAADALDLIAETNEAE